MTVDHSQMKLGRGAVRKDTRTLLLAKYLETAELPPAPVAVDWSTKVSSWPMDLNDRLGCCTIAAAAHLVQAWSANAKDAAVILADSDVLAAYESIAGFTPNDPTTDRGAVELDVLTAWRQSGIGGCKIDAFAAVAPKNTEHVKQAIQLFGGLYIGLELPKSAQTQDVWDVPWYGDHLDAAPGSWGGHAIIVTAYDDKGLTGITWGAKKRLTWSFFNDYCSEAYACLSQLWIEANGASPAGTVLAALQADLASVTA